ncbi:MAG: DEAD/DEAH box helicase [Spirochaetales bacterium]|jgi:DNA repair protein RadD|nr:DEAD/DEAH box helicase [Spirochaetales bacterium]
MHKEQQGMEMKTIKLRDYQSSAIDKVRQSMREGNKHVGIMLATGGGKTVIAAQIIKSAIAKKVKCLFIVDRIDLFNQTSDSFDDYGIEHGIIQGDHWMIRPEAMVQICSIQTLANRRIPDAGLVIVDEFHSIYSAQLKLMKSWNNIPMIGLSATPFTKGLGIHWDSLVVGATSKQLIDLGYLSDFIAYAPTKLDLSRIKTVAGDFNQKELAKKVNTKIIIGDVVSTWLARGEFRKTICFAVDIAHSKAIVDEFNCNGVKAEHIDAYTDSDDRQEKIAKFRKGAIKILSSVDILTKGFDCPDASCLILARPTKSLIVHIQQNGRVLRKAEGKQNAIILDHAGNFQRLGFPTDDLPEIMCNGEKATSKAEQKERLPKVCPKCSFVKPVGMGECAQCGFVPERQTEIEARSGELQRIERVDTSVKQEWFSQLLHYARSKGYSDGWASHKYKEKFSVWPAKKTGVHPKPPEKEVLNFIKYLQIKGAAIKKKEGFHPEPQPGYEYAIQVRSDGVLQIKVTQGGKFCGWAQQTETMLKHVGQK